MLFGDRRVFGGIRHPDIRCRLRQCRMKRYAGSSLPREPISHKPLIKLYSKPSVVSPDSAYSFLNFVTYDASSRCPQGVVMDMPEVVTGYLTEVDYCHA